MKSKSEQKQDVVNAFLSSSLSVDLGDMSKLTEKEKSRIRKEQAKLNFSSENDSDNLKVISDLIGKVADTKNIKRL